MMKKMMGMMLAVVMLASCSSDPEFHGMTNAQKENYAKALAGVYKGNYGIVTSTGKDDDEVFKSDQTEVVVTDWEKRMVSFHNFPVSQLSRVVSDPVLAEALAKAPDIDVTATYNFYEYQENGDVSWGYSFAPVSFNLHYNNADHHLVLELFNNHTYYRLTKENIEKGAPLANQSTLHFGVDGIYEGETVLEDFSVWGNSGKLFITYFDIAD